MLQHGFYFALCFLGSQASDFLFSTGKRRPSLGGLASLRPRCMCEPQTQVHVEDDLNYGSSIVILARVRTRAPLFSVSTNYTISCQICLYMLSLAYTGEEYQICLCALTQMCECTLLTQICECTLSLRSMPQHAWSA